MEMPPKEWPAKSPQARIQDHGRASLAHAVDVQAVASHVDHLARRRIGSFGKLCSDSLVDRPEDGEGQQDDDQPQERPPDPPYDPSCRSAAHYPKSNMWFHSTSERSVG